MIINFIKMHGLGNDFVIIDNTQDKLSLTNSNIQFLCDRHFGIGCDQLILSEDIVPRKIIKITIFNANGSRVAACGNATRCVAYYAMKKYQIKNITIQTQNRSLEAHMNTEGNIILNMGKASFDNTEIPLLDSNLNPMALNFQAVGLEEPGIAVNVGNPHVVFIVPDLNTIDLAKFGPLIENYSYFPNKTNVEFIQILDRYTIRMRVWERGTGITTACGTGAAAVFAVAHKLGLINNDNVRIILDGGELSLHMDNEHNIILEGKATLVFEGNILLDE